MKRVSHWLCCLGLFLVMTSRLSAEDAAAVVAREAMEENFKRLNGRVEQLEISIESLRREIARLTTENSRLRDELVKASDPAADRETKEKLKWFEGELHKLDKQRIADNEKFIAQFRVVGEMLKSTPAPVPTTKPSGATPSDHPTGNNNVSPDSGREKPITSPTGQAYEYKIKSGDILPNIVKQYRDAGVKVTQRQIMDANPKVNWTKLKIGQSILIPISAP